MAKLISINISEKKGVIKKPVSEVEVRIDHGIVGDAHAGNWHRQISILANESIDKIRAKGMELESGNFAENFTTEGIELFTLPIGQKFRIGDAHFELTQIGKECHHGCEIRRITGDCVMPREGIFVKVLKNGIVKVGDSIELI
jgi:MOSC domain-containing protein YiiM